jgi:hypothetical protein
MINWLNFGIAVAWFCKIGFHFAYIKKTNKNIKEANFISFFLKIENLATSILIISPLFFSRNSVEEHKIKSTKRSAKLSTYMLWAMFAITGFYLYHHPPKKEKMTIGHDLTRDNTK